MLYRSNILALVGGWENPKYDVKKLVIWDDREGKVITELKFSKDVLNVKLKKDRLINKKGLLSHVKIKSMYSYLKTFQIQTLLIHILIVKE